jgi:hypothetical protein
MDGREKRVVDAVGERCSTEDECDDVESTETRECGWE